MTIPIPEIERRLALCEKATRAPWVEGLMPRDESLVFPATKATQFDRDLASGPYADAGMFPTGIDAICTMQVSNMPNFRNDATFIADSRNNRADELRELRALMGALSEVWEMVDGYQHELAHRIRTCLEKHGIDQEESK